jgi:predicted HicB family RNase H-like nuclease
VRCERIGPNLFRGMAKRSEGFVVRMTPELRAEIELAAAEERRSLASVARQALLDWAAQRLAERAREAA